MNFQSKKYTIATLIFAAWIVFPFLVLALFNFPSSDDYYDWMLLQKFGALKATWHYYFNWSGRYFTHLIAFLFNPLQVGERLGGTITALFGITFLCADAYLLSRIFKAIFQVNQDIRPIFILFLILFFCYLPFPNETVYWFTGMIAYMPGLTACLYWMYLHKKELKTKFEEMLWFFLPVFAGGSGELSLCLMGWLLVLNFEYAGKNRRRYVLVFGLFLVAAAIELFSPGSAERMRYFAETAGNPTHNFAFAATNSIHRLWHYLRDWTRSTPVLTLAVFSGILVKTDSSLTTNRIILPMWIAGLLVPLAMFFVFHFGSGMIQAPGRLINVVYIYLQTYIFFSTFYLIKRFANVSLGNRNRLLWLGLLIIAFQASFSSRWRGAVSDFPILRVYSKLMTKRIETTKQQKMLNPNSTLTLHPIDTIPYTSFFSELSSDSSHWYNEGYAAYHGIKAINIQQ